MGGSVYCVGMSTQTHPDRMTAIESLNHLQLLRSKFIGMVVSAQASSDGRPIYGLVKTIRQGITVAGGRFLMDIENAGLVVPADSRTVQIESGS